MQYNNLLALFGNWDEYTRAIEESRKAVGTLQEQQDTYAEGTQAHLRELKTAQEALYQSLLKPEDIKDVVDVFINITDAATLFFNTIGGGKNALLGLGSVATQVFGKQLASGIATSIINLQGLRDNAAKVSAQFEIMQQFNRIDIDDEATQKLVEMKEQVLQYGNIVTLEQQNQANELIKTTNELYNQKEAWEQNKQAAQDFYKRQTGEDLDFKSIKNETELNLYKEEIKKYEKEYKNVNAELDDFNQKLEDAKKAQEKFVSTETEKDLEDYLRQLTDVNDIMEVYAEKVNNLATKSKVAEDDIVLLSQALKDFKNAVSESVEADNLSDLEEALTRDSKVEDAGKQLAKVYTDVGNKIRQEAKDTASTIEVEFSGASDSIENKIEIVGNEFENLGRRWNIEHTVQQYIQLTSLLSQVIFTYNSLINVLNTWKNEEINFEEKLSQTFMLMSTSMPMLISSIERTNSLFGTTNIFLGIYNGLKERENTLTNLNTASRVASNIQLGIETDTTKKLIVALGEKIAAENLDLSTMNKSQISMMLKNIAIEQGTALTSKQTLAIIKQIEVEKIHHASLTKSTILQNAWNASLLSNPIVLTIAALGALIFAINKYTEARERSIKATIDAAREERDAALASQEEINDTQELYKTYVSLYDTYKKTSEGKDDLRKSTEELCDALGIEASTLDMLSGKYDNINKEIAKRQKEQAEEALKTAKTGRDAAKTAAMMSNTEVNQRTEEKLNTIRLDAGFSAKDEKEVSDLLASRLEALNLDIGINRAGMVGVDFTIDIKNTEDFIKVYEEAIKVRDELVEKFKDDPKILQQAETFNSLEKFISEGVEDYKKYEEAQENIAENLTKLADAQARLELEEFDISNILSFEDFEKYRAQYLQFLEKVFAEDDSGVKKTKEELEQIANEYLSSFDVLSEYVEQFDIIEELRERLTGTETEIEAFIQQLQDSGELELFATIGIDVGTSVEEAKEDFAKFKSELIKQSVIAGEGLSRTLIENIQSGKVNYKNIEENEDYQGLIQSLEEVRKQYPEIEAAAQELSKVWNVGTQSYIEALETIEDKLSSLNIEILVEAAEGATKIAQEELEKITSENGEIKVDADTSAFEEAIENLLDANYDIDIAIHTEAEQEFDSIMNAMDDIYDKASMIGEGFIVAAEDIRELNNTFPGIIDNLEYLNDGTIRLSEESVNVAIRAAEAEVAADGQATIQKLQHQVELLEGKKAVYQQIADAAQILANNETTSEEESSQARATLSQSLEQLKVENSQIAADSQMNNAAEIATNSQTNAGILAENFSSAFSTIVSNSASMANAVMANMASMATGGGAVAVDISKSNYKGRAGEKGAASLASGIKGFLETGSKESAAGIYNMANSLIDSTQKQINDIEGMIVQIGSKGNELGKAFNNIRSGRGSGGGKGGGGGGKDPEFIDYLEDEADRYHDINLELEKLETNLDRLEKQQDKLYGEDLIDNLNEQLRILEKQKDAYAVKLKIAKQEAKEIRDSLALQGVTFDSEGYISNYAVALQTKLNYVNQIIDQYNAMSADEQEKFKDAVEQAKEDYETFVDQMSNYDELISQTLPEIEDSIQDAVDQGIEINIKKFTMEVELRLEMGEAERDFNEFQRKVVNNIKDDDILGNAESKLKDYISYFDTFDTGIGTVQKLTDQINDTIDQIDDIDNGDWASVYGDNKAQALEDLQKYYEELMQQLEDVVDLVDEIKESYLDMIDEAVDAFDKQVDQYEYIKDILDHDMNVIGLIYGDKAYAQMAQYYDQIEKNNNQELDFLKKRVAYAEDMMNKETDPKAREKWEEEWMDALEKLNDKVEDSIQNIIDKYSNAINKTFEDLNKKVTSGLGLDYIEDEWDLLNKNADQYLDTINALYGMQELENKYLDAIDQTDNLSSQQKLNDLMNEQLDMLKSKDKLTEYDIQRANLRYEIALKEIALQEAQQNKSQLRLRRDSQGNYSYQFVSDQDQLKNAEDDLLAAKNDLYNFDKEHYKDNLDEIYSYYVEFQEKYKEIMLDMSLSDEERQQRALLLQEQYGQLINGLVQQNEWIKQNLYESTFEALEGLYETNSESFEAMTGQNIDAFRNLTETQKDLIINDLIPQWDSGVQHMADVFAGEGGFIPTCTDAFEELDQTTRDYQDSLSDLEQSAGITFDSLAEGYDKNIEKAQALLVANDDLIKKYDEQISAILRVIDQLDELIDKYGEAYDAAISATEAAYEFAQAQRDISVDMNFEYDSSLYKEPATIVNPYQPTAKPSSGGGSSGGSGGSGGGGVGIGGVKTPKYYVINSTSGLYLDMVNNQMRNQASKNSVVSMTPNGSGIKVKSKRDDEGSTYYIWNYGQSDEMYSYKKPSDYKWIPKYKTGGYTGDWGDDSGRLAILHKKELVLNDSDTENMLSAVSLVRDIAGMLNNLNENVMNRVLGLSMDLGRSFNNFSHDKDLFEQNVHIDASFPGVRVASEIQEAIENLTNVASQRAFNTNR